VGRLYRTERFVRTILRRRPSWQAALWAAAALALATSVRVLLQPLLGPLVLFAPYYPAVLFVTVLLGWEAGAAVTAGAALLADWLFAPSFLTFDAKGAAAAAVFMVSAGAVIVTAQWLRTALQKLEGGSRAKPP
jgi:hypothetical protein